MHERTCPWIWEGVFRIWDLVRGRYEGIGGSAAGGMLYCCTAVVTARYGAVLISWGGMIRGVLGDIGGGGWFEDEGCVIMGVIVLGDEGAW